MVERRSPKPNVVGSSPAARAKIGIEMVNAIKKFMSDVQSEMKKVTWPTREQLRESTNVVIGVTLVITLIVFIMDQGLSFIL